MICNCSASTALGPTCTGRWQPTLPTFCPSTNSITYIVLEFSECIKVSSMLCWNRTVCKLNSQDFHWIWLRNFWKFSDSHWSIGCQLVVWTHATWIGSSWYWSCNSIRAGLMLIKLGSWFNSWIYLELGFGKWLVGLWFSQTVDNWLVDISSDLTWKAKFTWLAWIVLQQPKSSVSLVLDLRPSARLVQ